MMKIVHNWVLLKYLLFVDHKEKAKRNKLQRKNVLFFLLYSYSCFWIGGLKAECEPLPIIDGFWLLISNGNRRGIVDNGKRNELGINNGERKNCNQSVELRLTRDKEFDDGNGGGNGK